MKLKNIIILFIILSYAVTLSAGAELTDDEIAALFVQANDYFRQANSTQNSDQAKSLYEKAILSYEKIIDEGGIKNVKLYYNLGNAYFLNGRIGKAILNYRRAEQLGSYDADLQKNLAFARENRMDLIAVQTQKRVLETLFFWHYDFPLKIKFLLMCISFGFVCIGVAFLIWLGRNTPVLVTVIIFGIITICFLGSVFVEAETQGKNISGVITASEVTARQGDGQNYPPSFKEPLHEGTEFELIESRPGWLHIELSDGTDSWITDDAAELV